MQRFEAKVESSLFRRSEWFRLMSMLMLLAVLYVMFQRARDAKLWRWLASDSAAPTEAEVARAATIVADQGELFDGPTDLDPDEAEAAQEVFAAVSDRNKLSVEEMPAYWRLWRWTRAQSLDSLRSRSRGDLSFSHFIEEPDKHRGEIVRLRLHLRRSLSWEIGPEERSGGAKVVYEGWGWSDDSLNFYCIVFTQPPPAMAIGPNVYDEVTFYGYFLKLVSYRDQEDKLRMAPMLIGRVEQHAGIPVKTDESPWMWGILVAGGVMLLIIVTRWTRMYAFPKVAERTETSAGRASVATWLDSAQANKQDFESSAPDGTSIDTDIKIKRRR